MQKRNPIYASKKKLQKAKGFNLLFSPLICLWQEIQETFVFESNLTFYLRSRRQCNQVGKGMVFPKSSHYTSHRLNMDPLDRK